MYRSKKLDEAGQGDFPFSLLIFHGIVEQKRSDCGTEKMIVIPHKTSHFIIRVHASSSLDKFFNGKFFGFAVLSHAYRYMQRRDGTLHQITTTAPQQHLRMENGGIVLPGNLHSSFSQSHKPLCFKASFSR